ncbi:MAG TPA: low molecular weight phosphotyrosine protein phosphatase, partial [Myxococcota bacterium]|nr:low molecular weight phosphotyrosine protein phosphatase [Myxococcota bacterium]
MRRSVLFVCRGNICRSPLAQAVFEHEVRARGLTKIFYCDSRGTHGDQIGKGADPRAQMVATMHGLDLSSHRAHQIRLKDFA